MSKQDKQELDELQDPATWEDGEHRPPVKSPRAVVSVAFSREDFERVEQYARSHGMRTSEFIRTAALERMALPDERSSDISVSGGTVRTGVSSVTGAAVKSKVAMAITPVVTTA